MIRAVVLAAVFLSGAALMSLEMAGFRLVQPEFGSDVVVWGSLISVFLGGLAIGAFLGGRLADRRPALWKLGAILALGGVVALSIPLYSDAALDYMFPGEGAPLPEEWGAGDTGAVGQLVVYLPPDLRWPCFRRNRSAARSPASPVACRAVRFGVARRRKSKRPSMRGVP